MKNKIVYSFFTSEGWRTLDIKAYNPKQAYKIAIQMPIAAQYGYITNQYIKYGKDGISPIDRVYTLKIKA